MTEGITAEDIVELFRRDARARRELAVLLVSEPEVRLAIVNAVLRDVATREDIERLRGEFRREMEALRGYVDARVRELREYVDRRVEELRRYVDARFKKLKEYVDERFMELREYVDKRMVELKEYVDSRFDRLEAEVRELGRRLWWVVGTLIVGWLVVVIEQLLLHLVGG